jgi:hypothetical protein
MAEIVISRRNGGDFRVQVWEEGGETIHEVSVPQRLLARFGRGEGDRERLVRESFRFLLEREPASAILRRFSLEEISRYFPEYEHELARRLR